FSVVFHPPDSMHRCEMSDWGGQVFTIEISDQWLERLREYARVAEISADLHGGDLAWLATRLYREFRESDDCSPLAIEGLALEMMAALVRNRVAEEKRPPKWLSRVLELLQG